MALRLGDIIFGVSADTKELTRAQNVARGLAKEFRTLKQSIAEASGLAKKSTFEISPQDKRSLKDFIKDLDKIKERAKTLSTFKNSPGLKNIKLSNGDLVDRKSVQKDVQALEMLEKALRDVSKLNNQIRQSGASNSSNLVGQNNAAIRELGKAATTTKRSVDSLTTAQNKFKNTTRDVKDRLKTQVGSLSAANRAVRKFSGGLDKLSTTAVLVNGPLGGTAARLAAFNTVVKSAGLGTAAFVGGLAAAAFSVAKLGKAVLSTGRLMSRTRSQFEAVFGSAEEASKALDRSIQIARRTGQDLKVILPTYAKFSAALKGTALEGEKGTRIFSSVGAVISKLQLPADQAKGIFKALEQIISKGNVQAEELRNQLGDRLPGAFQIAARAMGVTTEALNDMLKKGQVASTDFLPKFSKELLRTFNLMPDEEINNFQTALNNLSTANTQFFDKLDKVTGASKLAVAAIRQLTDFVDFLRRNLDTIIPVAGAVSGVLLAIAAPAILRGFLSLIGLIGRATGAMGALNLVMNANPAVKLTSILIRLTAVLGGAAAGYTLLRSSAANASEAQQALTGNVDDFINAQTVLQSSMKKTTADYIKNVKLQIEVAQQQIKALTGTITAELRNAETGISAFLGRVQNGFRRKIRGNAIGSLVDSVFGKQNDPVARTNERVSKLNNDIAQNQQRLEKLKQIAVEADKILDTSTDTGGRSKTDSSSLGGGKFDKGLSVLESYNNKLSTTREKLEALRNSSLGVDDLNQKFAQQEELDSFSAKLRGAGLSAEETKMKIGELSTAMTQLAEAEKEFANTQEAIKTLQEAGSQAFDTLADSITDAFLKGELSMQTFADVAKNIAADILKTFIQLSVVNPLKNSIFGTNQPTLGGNLLGSGGGDLLGNLFGGFKLFRKGGAFDSEAKKFASGGVINSPTRMLSAGGPVIGGEAGPEAIMPLQRNSKGELGVSMQGGAQRAVNVYISTPDVQGFRRSEAQIAGQVARMANIGGRNL